MNIKELRNRLNKDLEKRINPEKSRIFDLTRLRESQKNLEKIREAILKKYPLSSGTKKISVVGSNGKGSVAWFLSFLLCEKGLVGLYSSPHLLSYLERIRINGKNISTKDLFETTEELRGLIRKDFSEDIYNELSYFELFTCASFLFFQKNNCLFQIFEAGLGGTFDATRSIKAEITVLTKLSLEHTKILGNTYQKILKEKLGILGEESRYFFYMDNRAIGLDGIEIEKEVKKISENLKCFGGYSYLNKIQTNHTKNKKHINHKLHNEHRNYYSNYLEENRSFAQQIVKTIFSEKELGQENSKKIYKTQKKHPPLPLGRLEKYILKKGRSEKRKEKDNTNVENVIFFDVAHNPDAIKRSLSDLQKEIELAHHISQNKVLVIIGVLKERSLDIYIEAIERKGFKYIWLIQNNLEKNSKWAQRTKNKETAKKIKKEKNQTSQEITEKNVLVKNKKNIPRDLHKELQNGIYQGAIILGSHHCYEIFIKCKQIKKL